MSRTVILWATSVLDSWGGANPERALGAPDGVCASVSVDDGMTVGAFRGGYYEGLSALLGSVTFGDTVTPTMLASADVIAFEGNGGSPGGGGCVGGGAGGWESCVWDIGDGSGATYTIHWNECGTARDALVVANGSISGAAYAAFFGISIPLDPVWSFFLFSLPPTIDKASPGLKIALRGVTGDPANGIEGTPEPDAIGIIACQVEDE